jgi:Tfp pilus assembly protein PilO
MSENSFLAAFFFPSLAAVIIFSMKYVSAILQAKVRLAQDEAYREIATKAAAAQAETAVTLSSLGTALGEIQSKLTGLEKILKEVE